MTRRLLTPETVVGAGIGFVLAYFPDPDRGRSRRAQARDQLMASQVAGVDGLESYLHPPGEPAPNVASALRAARTST